MLKNYGYSGFYRDDLISISVLLENPAGYNFQATSLLFSVLIKVKTTGTNDLYPDDFTFYIMDEKNQLHNTQVASYPAISTEINSKTEKQVHRPDRLIVTDFNHDFLFQDLRIAFYYRGFDKIHIIKLQH